MGAALTYQTSLLVELGPMSGYVVGSGGSGPEGLTAHGYNELGRISLRTLTSGIRAHGPKNLKNLTGHMVTGELLKNLTGHMVTGELSEVM